MGPVSLWGRLPGLGIKENYGRRDDYKLEPSKLDYGATHGGAGIYDPGGRSEDLAAAPAIQTIRLLWTK